MYLNFLGNYGSYMYNYGTIGITLYLTAHLDSSSLVSYFLVHHLIVAPNYEEWL